MLRTLLVLALTSSAALAQPADLVLHNGVVHTAADDAAPATATAIAVRDGVIVIVGDDEAALALRRPETRVIDLGGAFVMPGFNDCSLRFQAGAVHDEFNLASVTTTEQFQAAVTRAIARLPEGQWLVGAAWDGDAFTPDMREIEDIAAAYPVFLRRGDGIAFAANRAAITAAGVDPDDPLAPEVMFLRDDQGELTGVLTGRGVEDLFRQCLPNRVGIRRREQQTLRTLATLAPLGITSVSDTSDDIQRRIFERLQMANLLTCRVFVREPIRRWEDLLSRGITRGAGDDWVRRGAVTGTVDGSLRDRTARLLEPYTDDPAVRGRWRGIMMDDVGGYNRQLLLKLLLNADQSGLQICVSATGDEANAVVLDLVSRLRRMNGNTDRRVRLGPAAALNPDDLAGMSDLRLVVEAQPGAMVTDLDIIESRLGPVRSPDAYAYRALADGGVTLAMGSGWPGPPDAVRPLDPLLVLHAAVTRQTTAGAPAGGWQPGQRLTMEEAIRAYTRGSAYASFEEKKKGTIESGRYADLVVLSRNLLEIEPAALLDTEVLFTIAGGNVVYEKP